MAKMTWQELKTYLESMTADKLDSFVDIYDASTGGVVDCDIIELTDDNETWMPYIGINLSNLD